MIKKILTAFLMLMLVGALSSMPAQAAQDWMQSYHHIETMLGKAEEAYAAGDKEGTKKIVNDSSMKLMALKRRSVRRFPRKMQT